MGDSSDEDFNSDDEFIDLEALWRDPPFLDDPETEDPEVPDISSAEDDSPPRIIELTPYVSTTEESADPLENLMSEITDMSRRVSNARYLNRLQIARQRILDLGRPVVYRTRPMEEEVTTSSAPSPQPTWSTNAGPSRYQEDQFVEDDQIPYRFSQLRHMVAGTSPIPPRWARGRQTFSMLSQNVGRMVDSSTQDEEETIYVDAVESETRFVLPGAIREREPEPDEPDEDDLAERAMFVSDLVFSSLVKHNEARARFALKNPALAHKYPRKRKPDKKDSQPGTSKDTTDEAGDPNAKSSGDPKLKKD